MASTRSLFTRLVIVLAAPVLIATTALPSQAQPERAATTTDTATGPEDMLVDRGVYFLMNVDLDRYLSVEGDQVEDNVVTTELASSRSAWRFSDNGDGTWGLRNVATGGWLDGDDRGNDWNVEQSESASRDDRWRITHLDHDEFELVNAALHRRLDADRGHQEWNVDLAAARRGDRKWHIVPAPDDADCATTVAGLVTAAGFHDFEATWSRLVNAVDANPNLVTVASVDHSAAAASVGLSLAPNRVLVFGNPALGTPLLQVNRMAGLDLPQKIQVWVDERSGTTCVGFNAASFLAASYELQGLAQIETIDQALRGLAGQAAGRPVDATPLYGRRGYSSYRSDNDFETTWANLVAAVEQLPGGLGFTVDHGANSGEVLGPTRLAVFLNPNLGTPLMAEAASIGIDLPLKMMVRVDGAEVWVDSLPIEDVALRHGLDRDSPQVTALSHAMATVLLAAATGPGAPAAPCVVGDECPAQRLVDSRGLCTITAAYGDPGDSLFVGTGCDDRPRALHDPTRQVEFPDDGTIRVNGWCLTSAAVPSLQPCVGESAQRWTVSADGVIRDETGDCLVAAASREVHRTACTGDDDQRWGFIGINTGDPFDVKQVYITANDSSRTDRAHVLQSAVERVHGDWVASGATWQINPTPIEIGLDASCTAITGLGTMRTVAIRELSLLGEFSLNSKYNVIAECPVAGAANASRGVAVYAQAIFDLTESQMALDPNGAADGALSEIGVFGHELGHTFGLPHENCATGGWQGGNFEEAGFQARGLPGDPTRGPMCNGAFYPNIDQLADYQHEIVFDQSCAWFSECTGIGEYGADGRPYSCSVGGSATPSVFWDVSVDGRFNDVEVRQFVESQDSVSTSGPYVWSRNGAPAVDYVFGEVNYFAIGAPGASPAERVSCGSFGP